MLQMYQFEKVGIPSDPEEGATLAEKLMRFSVSLMQFKSAAEMDDVTMYVCAHLIMGKIIWH